MLTDKTLGTLVETLWVRKAIRFPTRFNDYTTMLNIAIRDV